MSNRTTILVTLAIALAVATGCSRSRDVQPAPVEQLYEQGINSLERGNFANAIAYFERLEALFPFSDEARQAQLDLIYAYYRNGDIESTIDASEQFMRENPTHPRVDYALYMQGLVYFAPTTGVTERMLRVDLTERPPVNSMRSFSAFQQLVQRFPDSEYVPDARERMLYLRNLMAAHEVHAARYYLRRGAYVAALNRARYCVETFSGAPQTREALEVMITAYERLGLSDMASNARAVLAENFPDR